MCIAARFIRRKGGLMAGSSTGSFRASHVKNNDIING
jgi:hypothetical protein